MKRLYVFAMTCFVLFLSLSAYASSPDVMTIINKMKQVRERALESAEKIRFVLRDGDQTTSEIVAGCARKQLPEGNSMLIVLLQPKPLEGLAYLFREAKDLSVTQWVYIPAIRRTREIVSPWNGYDNFLNTDFTYADLGFFNISGEQKLLGEEKIDGKEAYKIQSIPRAEARYYSRIITWVSKDNYLPLRQDYYDIANKLWKREEFKKVEVIDGTPVPRDIRMTDLQANRSTDLVVDAVRTDLQLPDEIFAPERLQSSLECPIWKSVCEVKSEKK